MTTNDHSIGEPQELAALYAAGAMTAAERQDFERHLDTGCTHCAAELSRFDAAVEDMAAALQPLEVGDHIKETLMSRIDPPTPAQPANPQVWKQWESDVTIDRYIRRAREGAWEGTGIAGVEVRRLFSDPTENRMTALVRMAPGTSYPAHVHNGPEECYVLQGDLRCGDQVLHSGDYERRAPGSHHGNQSTKDGCLLLIVSSLTDELTD